MQLRRALVVLAATASLVVGAAPAGVAAPPERAVREAEVVTHELSLGGRTDRATSPHPLVLVTEAGVLAALERRPR